MSADFPMLRNAETMSFAFMAKRASNAIEMALMNKPIGPDEKDVLGQASKFLREISNGANISAHGTFREGLSPTRSLAALDIAFGPIDALRQLVSSEKDVAQLFDNLSKAVEMIRTSGLRDELMTVAENAKKFFDALSAFVLNDLAAKNPPLGSSVVGDAA